MMKIINYKTLALSLLLSLSIVLTACVIPNPFKKTQEAQESTASITREPENDNTSLTDTFKGKLTDLFKLNQNLECQVINNETVSGTTYVSGKSMRGDYLIALDPDDTTKVMESHMINDGETVYIWTSSLPTGMKLNANEWDSTDADTTETDDNDALKTDFDYDCKPWIVDQDKLSVPTDVTFVDLSNTLNSVKGMGCSACEMISDPTGQAQCKAKLGC